MLSHTRQTVQLKDDLRRFTCSLKAIADNFKDAVEIIEQVLTGWLDLSRSPPPAGALGEARPIDGPQRLLTVKEVAAYLGVSDRSIYYWIKNKNLPYRQVGDDVRFDLAEVAAWTAPESKALEKAQLRVVK